MMKMFCQSQGCGWSFVPSTTSAVATCPKCFGNWFKNEPPKPIIISTDAAPSGSKEGKNG